MLLKNHHLVIFAAALANVAIMTMFCATTQPTSPNKNTTTTIIPSAAKAFLLNLVALYCLFIAFGENKLEVYTGPVGF